MTTTPIYAGLAALLFVALSLRVIAARRDARIGLGDGGNPLLLRRLRVHGNFAEYAPMAIVLMALVEWQGAPALVVHVIGLCLLAGRISHAYGFSAEPERMKLRVAGMVLTFMALIVGAISNLIIAALGSSS